jgi:hypothetical protein
MLLIVTVLAMAQFKTFADAYMFFGANKNSVWDGFTTSGVFVPGGGHTIASFIWGPAGSINTGLGSVGTPTNSISLASPSSWLAILNDPQFHLGTNASSGALTEVNVNASGIAVGGISYNSSSTFPVVGMVGGQTYTIYCFAWDNSLPDPYQAAAAGGLVGWSNPFQYEAGNGVISLPLSFSLSGMQPFGVGVPEPTTFALACMGAVALILRRRRRLKG